MAENSSNNVLSTDLVDSHRQDEDLLRFMQELHMEREILCRLTLLHAQSELPSPAVCCEWCSFHQEINLSQSHHCCRQSCDLPPASCHPVVQRRLEANASSAPLDKSKSFARTSAHSCFCSTAHLKRTEVEPLQPGQFQLIQEDHQQATMGRMVQPITAAAVTTPSTNTASITPKLLPRETRFPVPETHAQVPPQFQNPVFQLISLMNGDNKEIIDRLTTLCNSREQCLQLSYGGIMPFVVQIIHDPSCGISQTPKDLRTRAGSVLHRLVSAHPEDKRSRREIGILRYLEDVRAYSDTLVNHLHDQNHHEHFDDAAPVPVLKQLTKMSYEDDHRHSMCLLGGLQAVAELLQCNFNEFDHTTSPYHCSIRIYSCKILVNLTFGDGTNKALLSSSATFLATLAHLVSSNNDEVRLNAAGIIRNLSWKTDIASRENIKQAKMIGPLLRSAMQAKTEHSLKAMLSALWNISAHWVENKQEICATEGALKFLVQNLAGKLPLSTVVVAELSGGILRNVCSVIADREDYRAVLRENQCLEVLVSHLRSFSIECVMNATGILWNLSARCEKDQQHLWTLGAVPMLKDLMRSKDSRIAANSGQAYRKLISAPVSHNAGRAQSVPRRLKNGRPVPVREMGSFDDDQTTDNLTSFRKNTSVPNSPLVSARSNLCRVDNAGGSKSERTRWTAEGLDLRRTQMTNLMSETRQKIKECSFLPTVAVSNHRNAGTPPLTSESDSDDDGTDQQSDRAKYVRPVPEDIDMSQEPYFQSLHIIQNNAARYSPYPDPAVQTSSNFSWQLRNPSSDLNQSAGEDGEARDEFTDYGQRSTDVQRTNYYTDLQTESDDIIRQFNTEGTPVFSTATSVRDLRSNSIHNRPVPRSRIAQSVEAPPPPPPVPITNVNSMFVSRSSTPGNLSDVELEFLNDEQNDKQSVYSECSRQVSHAVSPSDIPASPSLMPRITSKTKRRLPVPPKDKNTEFQPVRMRHNDLSEDENNILSDCINNGIGPVNGGEEVLAHDNSRMVPALVPRTLDNIEEDAFMPDSTRTFATEGTSPGTSISSLTLSGVGERSKTRSKQLPRLPLPDEAAEVVSPTKRGACAGTSCSAATTVQAPHSFWVDAGTAATKTASEEPATQNASSSPMSSSPEDFVNCGVLEDKVSDADNVPVLDQPLSYVGDGSVKNRADVAVPADSVAVFDYSQAVNPEALDAKVNGSKTEIRSQSTDVAQADIVPPPLPPPLDITRFDFSRKSIGRKSKESSPVKAQVDLELVSVKKELAFAPPIPTSEPPPLSPQALQSIERYDQDLLALCIESALPRNCSESTRSVKMSKVVADVAETNQEDDDLLADCIYAALPGKLSSRSRSTKKSGQPNHASARKKQIQLSLQGMSASHSAELAARYGDSGGMKKSQTFDVEKDVGKSHSLPRNHLKLSLAKKAVPASDDESYSKVSNRTYDVFGKNLGRAASDAEGTGLAKNQLVQKVSDLSPPNFMDLKSLSIRHMDSPFSSNHTLTDATGVSKQDLLKTSRENIAVEQRISSPDIFEELNQADYLASRFTSEASGEDDDDSRKTSSRPKIIKPVRVSSNANGQNGKKTGNSKSAGSVRETEVRSSRNGASRNIQSELDTSQLNGSAIVLPSARRDVASTAGSANSLSRLTKQATFVKSGHSGILPVIFPDTDVSKMTDVHKRFASITRGPRESFNVSVTSRPVSASPFRSMRSLSARPSTEKSISGVNLASYQSSHTVQSKEKPKKQPVVSKIAALLKGDKSKSKSVDKGKDKLKNTSTINVEPLTFDSTTAGWRKNSESGSRSTKSPTLSDQTAPRPTPAVSQRMTATLPKNLAAQAVMLNKSNIAAQNGNAVDKAKSQSKGSLTITSV